MRRLMFYVLFLMLLSGECFAASPIQGVIARRGSLACTASYDSEIHINEAADRPIAGDTDATTGWVSTGLSVFDSITTDPQLGNYHLAFVADSDGDRAYYDLSTILTPGTIYKISFYAQNDVAGGNWGCKLTGSNLAGVNGAYTSEWAIPTTTTTNTNFTGYIDYSTVFRYLICYENSATNNGGIYFDNLSITAAFLCYGSELHTNTNAASTINESDATTGFTAIETATLTSEEDQAEVNGSSAIKCTIGGTPANDGCYIDIGAGLSGGALSIGTKYMISFWVLGDGTNAWKIQIGSAATGSNSFYASQSSAVWTQYSFSFVYSANYRYLNFIENNASDAGYVYIDALSIKAITGE